MALTNIADVGRAAEWCLLGGEAGTEYHALLRFAADMLGFGTVSSEPTAQRQTNALQRAFGGIKDARGPHCGVIRQTLRNADHDDVQPVLRAYAAVAGVLAGSAPPGWLQHEWTDAPMRGMRFARPTLASRTLAGRTLAGVAREALGLAMVREVLRGAPVVA